MNVYFICYPQGPEDTAGYEHNIIAIAEGLKEQGFTARGNVNYWLDSIHKKEYLIEEYKTDNYNEFDAVVFSSNVFNYGIEHIIPEAIFDENRQFKLIMIDSSDGLITPGFDKKFRNVDFVLKCHYVSRYEYPQNFVPWQFGLTNRIIRYASKSIKPFHDRDKVILSNFRVAHHLRSLVEKISKEYFYPVYNKNSKVDDFNQTDLSETDYLYWRQTGKRHNPNYYKRLGSSLISNAAGGTMQSKNLSKGGMVYKVLGAINNKINLFPHDRIYQYDSWRLWESLVCGCCTMHVDFDLYGVKLQEMPINGQHYIGIDLNNPSKTVEILNDISRLEEISEKGRNWALEHYSPLAVSKRFIRIISE